MSLLADLERAESGLRLRDMRRANPTMALSEMMAELTRLTGGGLAEHSRLSERWRITERGREALRNPAPERREVIEPWLPGHVSRKSRWQRRAAAVLIRRAPGELSTADLAEELVTDPPTARGALEGLHRQGLVVRRPDNGWPAHDKRPPRSLWRWSGLGEGAG